MLAKGGEILNCTNILVLHVTNTGMVYVTIQCFSMVVDKTNQIPSLFVTTEVTLRLKRGRPEVKPTSPLIMNPYAQNHVGRSTSMCTIADMEKLLNRKRNKKTFFKNIRMCKKNIQNPNLVGGREKHSNQSPGLRYA